MKVFSNSLKPTRDNQFNLLLIILVAGTILRIFHFLDNRSLWEDEVFLASSLVKMNFHELAYSTLDYQQRAPIGFLWLVRLSVILFGNHEMPLRLVSLISGVSGLFLFVPVAQYFLQNYALPAVFIVAFASPLVYHSVELKQYGVEFFTTVLSLFVFIKCFQKPSPWGLFLGGLIGAFVLWFSYSSLFVLGGIAIAVSVLTLLQRDWKMFFLYLIPFSLWLVSFLIQYVFFISKFPEEAWLQQFWRNREAFMPFPPQNFHDLAWPFTQLYALIKYPLGLTWFELDYNKNYNQLTRAVARMPLLPILIGCLGVWEFIVKQRKLFLILVISIIITLLASSLELYPVKERLIVFLAPILVIVITKGLAKLDQFALAVNIKRGLIVLFLFPVILNAFLKARDTNLFGEYKKSFQREGMQFIEANYKQGDVVYVYWNNLPSFRYYEEINQFHFNAIYDADQRKASNGFESYFQNLSADFKKIKQHRRLWFIYKDHNGLKIGDIEKEPKWYYLNVDANKLVRNKIFSFGTVIDSFPQTAICSDIKVYLLELNKSK